MKKAFKILFGGLSLFSMAQAVSLDDLYSQYDNLVVAKVAHVQSVKIALYPNKGKNLSGQIILPKGIIINKIQLQLKNDNGEVFWEKTDALKFSKDAAGNLPFNYKFSANLPKDEKLTFGVKLFQDSELVAVGKTSYENKDIQLNILAKISEAVVKVEKGAVSVLATIIESNLKEEVSLKVTVLDSRKELVLEQISKSQKLKQNEESQFELKFDSPVNPGNYWVELSLQNDSQEIVSGTIKKIFLIDGTFAKIRKLVFSTPDVSFEKGQTVEMTSEGFVNKNISSLNVVAKITSPAGKELFVDDFLIPVNKFKEFSFNKQFVLPEDTEQLLGSFKIYNNGDLLVSETFNSQVFAKKITEKGVVSAETTLTENPTEEVFTVNWLLVLIGMGILLFVVVLLMFMLRKNSQSIKKFLLFLAFGGGILGWANIYATLDNNCSPEEAIISGINLHCQFFEDEVYNGVIIDTDPNSAFGVVPIVTTTIGSDGSGLLVTSKDYDVTLGVCKDSIVNCDGENIVTLDLIPTGFVLKSSATNWSSLEALATSIFDIQGEIRQKKIAAIIYSPQGESVANSIRLSYTTNPYELVIDNQKPDVEFVRQAGVNTLIENPIIADFYNNGTSAGEINVAENFTKDEIIVNVACDDGSNGAGCMNASYELLVSGNFCDDTEICNTTGTNDVKICDKVGNCISEELVLKNFDNQAPSFGGTNAAKIDSGSASTETGGYLVGNSSVIAPSIKAFENFLFSLKNISDESTLLAGTDTHACGIDTLGNDILDEIVNYNSICHETRKSCAKSVFLRGEAPYDASGPNDCVSACPTGFEQVDCNTANTSSTGECCLPESLLCGYRFPFCFPFISS